MAQNDLAAIAALPWHSEATATTARSPGRLGLSGRLFPSGAAFSTRAATRAAATRSESRDIR
jgi:hypothetical protein